MNVRYTDKSGDVISVKSDEEFLSMLVEFRYGARDVCVSHLCTMHGCVCVFARAVPHSLPTTSNETVIRLQLSRRRDEAHNDNGDTAILETMINPVIIINGVRAIQSPQGGV